MFRFTGYATVWGETMVDKYDNVVMAITSSHKNKQTDEYVVDYRDNYAKFCGDAIKNKALKLKHGDRIEIKSGTISCGFNKQTQKPWMSTTIWDFEMAGAPAAKPSTVDEGYNEDEDSLPV